MLSASPSARPQGPPPAVALFPRERLGDAELVDAIARGDREALGVAWDRYAGLVRHVLRGALGPGDDVEDLLQEVFIALLQGAGRLRDGAALRAYLVGVSVRKAAFELRRRKVRRWVMLSPTGELPETPQAPEDVEGRTALKALYGKLDTLSTRRRLAFVLRFVEEMEVLEVASALEVSESTAKREIAHARESVQRWAAKDPLLSAYLKTSVGESP